ncbi:MAG: beta-1,6-N-acetylglucosaminyltransferase [Dysgonamonadaceae bacterium]|jgi:hypothetical protein|nr:beta-1,6-N-acetylglucosaminyltransferase [Dysgonamonadaceae bacterium]
MVKQAILITAYQNIEQILEIISFFDERFEFYVHIDRRRDLDTERLENLPNVHLSRACVVHWGSLNHLNAILLLAKTAVSDPDIYYLHLITAQDFPCKPLSYFFDGFDSTKDYIRRKPMPCEGWEDNGGFDRLDYYNPYDIFDAKKTGKLINVIVKLQKILRIKRRYPAGFPKLYAGGSYWSLRREAILYILDYTERNPLHFARMKHTFCPEEFYIQSVLMTAPFAGRLVNEHLRYIDWSTGRGGYPAFLDETDFASIVASDCLFARKFDLETQNILHKYLLSK